ncbi:cytochrome P450 [Aspergillus terreus]|uniref:Cytochrome P450 n=1 Tax=Aspergillus terreus TaxID=33178 RepID=A0A5M3YTG1_ASPTE|nr:hypothetical protein ATETN484_0003049400 [Aspergillus terreus]GFF14483.1 cytochrome P450 [Aspergillus terreus]
MVEGSSYYVLYADDKRIHYLAAGPVNGPLIFFIHGWPGTAVTWKSQLDAFAAAEAQREIDAVLGDHELPSWTDYERLPAVAMIAKEILRWRPPAPGLFPHSLTKDEELAGMRIPKGTAVVLNVWGIHHDPERYPEPESFQPSRFAGQTQLGSVYANSGDHTKRDHYGYGVGRRICPGIHLAERALFIAIAKLLWAFSVEHKLDTAGNPIPVDVSPSTAYSDGFLN